MDRILDTLSDYAVSMSYEKLPESVVHDVKRRFIDTVGCAMGSYNMIPSKIARAHAMEVTSVPGSTVLGSRHQSAPELSAFANAVMARYFDFNDKSEARKGGHPSDNTLPVLAAAEYAGADIRSAIAGIVLAYEVQERVGDNCSHMIDTGWDYVLYVALASAAGAGKVMGLNKEQMANALALAVVPNAGTHETREGQLSMWKGCAAANAARNGVFAAMMARRGLTGPEAAFEGPCGFNKQFGLSLELPTLGGGNVPFALLQTRFKAYPSDFEAQCCVTPMAELHKEFKGKLDEIEKIEIESYQHTVQCAADSRDKWNPTTRETADHSLPYVAAVALARGTLWLDDFEEDRIRDPKIHALMQKIEVRVLDEFTRAWPEAYPFRVTVTTKSGQKSVQEVHYAKGHPKNPMSDRDIEAKFRRLAEPVMSPSRIDKALSALWHLEDMKSIPEVFSLFELDPAIVNAQV